MLDRYKVKLILLLGYHPILTFPNDRGIIEEALYLKSFLTKQLKMINLTRLYFKVVFLSDLMIAKLNYINLCYYQDNLVEVTSSYK